MEKKIHLIGNAHLDPTWLWRWQEGCGEVLQTFRSALDRLNEYDDFVFTCSSAAYYKWVEDIDPEMFEEIKRMVRRGRWVPVNGWWVQPDCNIPSGESFARQALYSQLYYYKKFGTICHTGYNVDSFGHNAMMPQLIKNSGMSFYVMMRPDLRENPDIPSPLFWWDSADGSRVLTYRIPTGYGESGKRSIDNTIDLMSRKADEGDHSMMLFYGVGNHGGGPTKGDIEHLEGRMEAGDCMPLEFSSPDDFFESICANQVKLPVWKDELQHHASGCYSATSLIKQLNRKAEYWLACAEKWNTVASKISSLRPATESFAEAWKKVCYNQFHDVMCGCSIMEAYEDARDSMGYAMTIAADEENYAQLKISGMIDTWLDGVSDSVSLNARHHCRNLKYPRPVVVFNPHSWDIEAPVRTYHPSKRVEDWQHNQIPHQNVRSSRSNDTHNDTEFIAKVPAMGYAVYWLWLIDFDNDEEYDFEGQTDVKATSLNGISIENKHLSVRFNGETGGIDSLLSKDDGCEYAGKENFCVPTVFNNEKPDTWAHNIFYFDEVLGTMKLESIELVEAGPVRSVVRTKHSYNKSVLIQDFILASEQKSLRVKCKAIWQEPLTILKMPFPLDGADGISTYEIPAGFIKRPCNGEEEPALKWGDLTAEAGGKRRGITVMSDSKYSYSCPENELRITLLRNSIFADHFSYRPAANFNYTDEGVQRFEYGIYPHSGDVCPQEATRAAELFACRPTVIPVSYHKGSLPQTKSFITVDVPNVIVTAVKLCEDGSGDGIIRCCETSGKTTRAMIKCDIFEAAFYADFNGNEIKTFRVDKDGFVTQTDFLEGIPQK